MAEVFISEMEPPDTAASLAIRVCLGEDGNRRLHVARDAADFLACAALDVLGHELLCSLDWGGGAGPAVVLESMRTLSMNPEALHTLYQRSMPSKSHPRHETSPAASQSDPKRRLRMLFATL